MINLKELDLKKASSFRYKEMNGKILLTNDAGDFVFLLKDDFHRFITGKLMDDNDAYKELLEKNFIKNNGSEQRLAEKFRSKNLFLGAGPVLHIIITTLRCNQKCIYCHASAANMKEKCYDMDVETAKKVVDTIFCAPGRNLTIEFQGGEPLTNWDVVKFVIDYAREKESQSNKNIRFLLVSNLLLLDKEKLDFLLENKVGICTSLDGPEALHNKNRSGHGKVVEKLRMAFAAYEKGLPQHLPSAIVTVSKHSLSYPREIVDEYVRLGFEGVFIRPLNPIGYAKEAQTSIDYSEEDYIHFYKETMDYMIELNKKGKLFFEHTAVIFLIKILTDFDPNFMDIRSPCGAGIGQIAYNYNGDVYTCDEGRMLARMGDESFKMGNVTQNTYEELIDHTAVKACCVSSCLDGLPTCSLCAYKPYCGVCPVYNYVEYGDIFIKNFENKKCKIFTFIMDYLFEKMQDEENLKIFNSWINMEGRR